MGQHCQVSYSAVIFAGLEMKLLQGVIAPSSRKDELGFHCLTGGLSVMQSQ